MAQTLGNNDKERNRRIKLVVDYIAKGASIRETQRLLEEKHRIKISVATISDYAKRGKKMVYEYATAIDDIFYDKNKDKLVFHDGSVNEFVKARVIKEANLYYVDGCTVEEIAKLMNISYYTVYRDLTEKLPKINEKLAIEIKKRMNSNRLNSKPIK